MTALIVVTALVAANVVGWLSVRGAGYRPWNWRVLLSPWLYYPWLRKREVDWWAEENRRWRVIAHRAWAGRPIICNDADAHDQPCDCGNRSANRHAAP